MGSMIPTKQAALAASFAGSPAAPGASAGGDAGPGHDDRPSTERVAQSLEEAAATAAAAGVSLDEFMQRAWSAYVDARPGLREHLADAQLVHQIQELRAAGKVGSA
jgi:hypothetical protein